jgi:hypothetical protein
MSKTITTTGSYVSKKDNKEVSFEFEYQSFANLQEAISELGEDKVLRDVQRMVKLDASNTSRESAKIANGDSTRKVQSEEDKAQAKVKREQDKALLAKIKNLSAEDRALLGL